MHADIIVLSIIAAYCVFVIARRLKNRSCGCGSGGDCAGCSCCRDSSCREKIYKLEKKAEK